MKPKGKIQQKDPFRSVLFYLIKVLLVSILYYTTAEIGLQLDATGGFAALFWLPTGISLAAVFLLGYRMFPGILLGAFFVNFFIGAPLFVACGIAVGNTLEAIIGAYLLKKVVGFNPSLDRIKDVLALVVLAALMSTVISATIGVSSLAYGGVLTSSYLSTWGAWWIGDMVSNIIVAPFLFVWSRRAYVHFEKKRALELIALTASIIVIGIFVFRGLFGIEIKNSPLTYIVFPPLIWAALRFGPREVVTALFSLSLFAVWGTSQGYGPFARGDLSESLLFLQSFMVVVSITSMVLAAAVSERRVLEKRKDDFISFASHELKTPVTSVKAYAQILQKIFSEKRERKAAKYLSHMDIQLNRLASLINNMLDLSKMQTSELILEEKRFSLQELLDEIIDTMQISTYHVILQKGKVSEDIYGDKERIGQVVTNLLSNAIKYSPHKGRIIISTKMTQQNIIISIRDYGVGIAAEHQQKIFDRFFRVTDDANRARSGLGIGLYLSKVIIKRHGGELWVKSKAKKGSEFSFSLPRV
jgi:signal transduction histidine kinase